MRGLIATSLVLALVGLSSAQCNHDLPNGQTCPDGKGPYFFADPDHCSRYWQCDEGCSNHMLCEKDYLYDDKHKWCNYPEQVECGTRDCDGRNCKKPDPPVDFDCPAPSGYFSDPHNCIKYYHCYENIPSRMTCDFREGQQLQWDPYNQWCDWPDRVDCGARPVCDVDDQDCHIVTHPPTTTKAPSPCDAFGMCTNPGDLLPQGTCDKCFCECASSHWTQLCCGQGLVFNKVLGECDWPADTPGC